MKASRARVVVQILLHVLIIGHLLAYYRLGLKRVGGADVQAFFHDFLGSGLISAGVILVVAAFLVTLVFGRIFCGWACHFGGFQDLAAWVLRKVGFQPAPLRTRLLHHLPYVLLFFTFILPSALRWLSAGSSGHDDSSRFQLRVDLGGAPWANLPGFTISVATFLACGIGLLFFFGSRGFCRYVCPYGAVFRLLDGAAPYRVRRKDACGTARCGPGDPPGRTPPCTAACPMGVSVHEETQRRGAVRNVDCVRCNLCVEACPRQALTLSFRPLEVPVYAGSAASSTADPPRQHYSYSLGREVLIAACAVGAFAAWDLVYAAHFLAAAMALGEGFLALFALEVFSRRDLKAARIKLRDGGRWTFAGAAVPAVFLLSLVGVLHAGTFKAVRFAAERAYHRSGIAERTRDGDPPSQKRPDAQSLVRAEALYRRALDILPGDRLSLHRYAAVLWALGDRRALEVAEGLAASRPEDRDARELVRRVRSRFAVSSSLSPRQE